jgi:hypothetical protein
MALSAKLQVMDEVGVSVCQLLPVYLIRDKLVGTSCGLHLAAWVERADKHQNMRSWRGLVWAQHYIRAPFFVDKVRRREKP